ncbi:hypothetical protein SETIT_8G038400v2 [Setaria italica]|uniref:DUF4220 domain-containing protein n=1 Tax=Setaria italica TaxID=4555 RepID=A0A368S3Y0_SETIT|nr:hypothetical protein SETIT_8G038400v2 [Setaria italica]
MWRHGERWPWQGGVGGGGRGEAAWRAGGSCGGGGGRLAPAVEELWNAWEIHSLILVSLFLQVFLFLFAGKRMRSNSTLRRLVLWLAYLSADSVATFVLGHLAVRAIEPSDQGLMSFWAPFALVHLGGQVTMTAFSMQDNELWKRHLLNLVIQAAVARYVVGKASWPDRRLKAALVLVFVSGFFKYAVRTWYLFLARPNFLKSPKSWKIYGQGKTSYEDKRERAIEDMGKVLHRLSKGSTESVVHVRSITLAATGKLPGMLDEFLSRDDHHNAYEHVGTLLVECYSRLYTKCYVLGSLTDGLRLVLRKRNMVQRKEWNIASTRGQLALHHRKATATGVDFPRSVLVWHIATDICFHYSGDKDAAITYSADGLLKKHCYKQMSRELSNYIMYLVFKCGVMLTTYSHVVHDDTLYEIAKKLSLYRRQAGVNPGDHKDAVITKLLSEEIKIEREESKEQVETSKVEHEGESKEEERDEIVQIEHEESANDDNNDTAAEDHMHEETRSEC